MRSRRTAIDSGNLDSLLDMMANVVGVLVVILAVTQMSVGDAMNRIRAHRALEAEERGRAEERSRGLETRLVALQARFDELAPQQAAAEHASLRRDLRLLRDTPGALELAGEDPSRVTAALARERHSVQRLEEHIATTRAQLASLRIRLDSMSELGSARSVRLPDPRPAPRGSETAAFFCRYGRTFRVDLDDVKAQLEKAFSSRLPSIPDIGSRELRWREIPPHHGRRGARLGWRRKDAGETAFEIAGEGSAFRSALRELHPRRNTIRFYVWGDSFEVYLKARQIAEGHGFLAGWRPFDVDQGSDWYVQREPTPDDAIPID